MVRLYRGIAASIVVCAAALAPAAAQLSEAPRYFFAPDGVVARATPARSAPVVAELGPGATPIEAVAVDGVDFAWRRVVAGEGVAWVSIEELSPAEAPLLGDTALPIGLACGGTEPFWSIRIDTEDGARGSWPWSLDRTELLRIENSLGARSRLGAPAAVGFHPGALLVVSPATCSDGMSDRLYPWSAVVLTEEDGGPAMLSGCCRLPDAFQR